MGRGKSHKVQFPCGSCRKECNSECLACEVCDAWFHRECQELSENEFKQWCKVEGEFMCRNCRQSDGDFDFLRGITRLEKASKGGIHQLRKAVTRESLLVGSKEGTYEIYETANSDQVFDRDDVASDLLKKFHQTQGLPVKTTGDGDCLFNAVSTLLYGNEFKSVELRYKTVLEMVKQESSIVKHSDRASIMLLSPDYNDAVLECAKLGAYSSTWTIIALSKVINKPIESIYPSVNGVKDLAYRTLNSVFNPECQGGKIRIMWSSYNKVSQAVMSRKKMWVPNHFVPVIAEREPLVNEKDVSSVKIEARPEPEERVQPEHEKDVSPVIEVRPEPSIITPVKVEVSNEVFELSPPAATSTPEDEWRMPKRKRSSNERPNASSTSSIQLSNKFEQLEQLEHEDPEQFPYMSDSEMELEHNVSSTSTSMPTCQTDKNAGCVTAEGPHRGKLINSKFLSIEKIVELSNEISDPLPSVPAGIKEDIYFIVDNNENKQRNKSGLRCEFWDDCGAWQKSTSPVAYIMHKNCKFISLTKRRGVFCTEKSGRKYEVVDPQPDPSELLIINRSYSKLKADNAYRRRVSWFTNVPETLKSVETNVAIYEYAGSFPGRTVHGNVKKITNKQPYTKTKPSVTLKIKQMVKHQSAKNVHDELNEGNDFYLLPRNLKQVQNVKYTESKKIKTRNKPDIYLNNLADHLIHVENQVYLGDPYIRSVNHLYSGPSVILYTDEQIQDIKRFCCRDEPAILGVDKTYNLGDLHLTTTVFKNYSVLKINTGEHPIFLGPSFLHSKSDFETFNIFFSNIAGHFGDDEIQKMVIGSDDETALRKSITRSFPGSTQIVCTRHLKNNVRDYLNKKVGVNDTDKNKILHSLFGENGLTDADSTILFDFKLEEIQNYIGSNASEFASYFESRIVPLLRNQVNIPCRLKILDKDWTNNNSESFNNLLKVGTNHKLEHMTDLIAIIYRIVKSQYKDCEKALVKMGNFILAPAFSHHELPIDVWCQKSELERQTVMKKFFRDKGRNYRTVTSSNGILTIPKTPNGGKKPNQRKRPAAERATPRKFRKL